MKKIMLLLVGMCVISLPASAAMNFYRDTNGKIVAEATTCQDAARLMDLMALPDDPPGGAQQGAVESAGEDENPVQTTGDDMPSPQNPTPLATQQGIQTILGAFWGDDADDPTKINGLSVEVQKWLEAANFDERQDAFITFVRDVNWKTGLYITWRDFSIMRRIRMACTGVNQLTKPMRVSLEAYVGPLDQTIEKASDAGVKELANAARGHSFNAISKLSLVGLATAIEKENPFILLALDEETYNKLVETEPKIAELFEDMYMFFLIRSVRMGDYNQNIDELIRIAKIGKGDAFDTWHVLSEYAKKMLELDRAGKLTPSDEKDVHIWRLETSMRYIREQVRIERRAAEIAYNDPNYRNLVREVEAGPKKNPSLNDRALELLQKSTQDEIKHLIRKYKAK